MPGVADQPSPDSSGLDQPIEIRVCERVGCGLRFSSLARDPVRLRCPRCRAVTRLVERLDGSPRVPMDSKLSTEPTLEVLLDNIRSAYNVGAILRTADGAGLRRAYLCGITPDPGLAAVRKTALGAEESVRCTSHPDGLIAAQKLLETGYRLWALEGGERAEPLHEVDSLPPGKSIVMVVGSETAGVDPGILRLCERVLAIPMLGSKASLNAAIAFSIAVHWLRYGVPTNSGG